MKLTYGHYEDVKIPYLWGLFSMKLTYSHYEDVIMLPGQHMCIIIYILVRPVAVIAESAPKEVVDVVLP